MEKLYSPYHSRRSTYRSECEKIEWGSAFCVKLRWQISIRTKEEKRVLRYFANPLVKLSLMTSRFPLKAQYPSFLQTLQTKWTRIATVLELSGVSFQKVFESVRAKIYSRRTTRGVITISFMASASVKCGRIWADHKWERIGKSKNI